MVDLKSYIPMIDAILSAANPDQATPKRIRKALQELFGVDLDSRRKEANKIIVERFQESQDRPKKLVSIEELIKQDESTAKRLVRGSDTKKRTRSGNNNNGSVTKKKRTGESTGGFNKTKVLLAEPLSEFLGETESTRTQVVKSVWDYIKRNNLQNPNDKREILCDDKMKPIFGEKVTMFSMNKALAKYIHNASDTTSTTTPATPVATNSSSPTVAKDDTKDGIQDSVSDQNSDETNEKGDEEHHEEDNAHANEGHATSDDEQEEQEQSSQDSRVNQDSEEDVDVQKNQRA